jgi:hypothetical protein
MRRSGLAHAAQQEAREHQPRPRVAHQPVLGTLEVPPSCSPPDLQEHERNDHQRELDEDEDSHRGGLYCGGGLPGDQLVQRRWHRGARRAGHRAEQYGQPEPGFTQTRCAQPSRLARCPSPAAAGAAALRAGGRSRPARRRQPAAPEARSSPVLTVRRPRTAPGGRSASRRALTPKCRRPRPSTAGSSGRTRR